MNLPLETIEENNKQELNINSKIIKSNTGNDLIFNHKCVDVIKQAPQTIITSDDKDEIFYKQPWYKNISVEPILFLYMFAFMLTNVVEQDLFLQKACLVNKNYSNEIFNNIINSLNFKYK